MTRNICISKAAIRRCYSMLNKYIQYQQNNVLTHAWYRLSCKHILRKIGPCAAAVKFEVSLIKPPWNNRVVRMTFLKVHTIGCCVVCHLTTMLTNVHFPAPFFEPEPELLSVNCTTVLLGHISMWNRSHIFLICFSTTCTVN